MEKEQIRNEIKNKVTEFIAKRDESFIPGKTPILTGLAVYDDKELNAIIETLLDGWFGLGKRGIEFEQQFAKYIGNKFSVLVNSGSSANLLALNAIKIQRNLKEGEIITPACAFPTTFNPILQLGFKPAVIDVDETLNITPEGVKAAINKNTVGIMFAHSLGNTARIDEIKKIADENNLFLIEDCCDALGSKVNGKNCGTFGHLATFSFYPAHGITLGEGGCVTTNDNQLNMILRSLRDWGRDCFCTTDEKNPLGKCGKRFDFKLGDVPYDHKYIYSQIGYNMKPLELQAAMGLEQLKKLNDFNNIRKSNFAIYVKEFTKFSKYVEIAKINKNAEPIFFGLPLIIKDSRIKRQELLKFLNDNKIATRLLFGGNLLKQPAYKTIEYALYGKLDYTDKIMKDCFWIGVHPGITEDMIKYVSSKLKEFFDGIENKTGGKS
jgi:CDP-6-deoxy-D-xylo-4-hexulose-3-dehydrase